MGTSQECARVWREEDEEVAVLEKTHGLEQPGCQTPLLLSGAHTAWWVRALDLGLGGLVFNSHFCYTLIVGVRAGDVTAPQAPQEREWHACCCRVCHRG